MTIPCTFKVNHCHPCNDPPVLNLSAEAEDRNRFLAVSYNIPNKTPVSWWNSQDCRNVWHYSNESQNDAYDAAARIICVPTDGTDGPPDGSPCSVPPCPPNNCEVPPCPPGGGGGPPGGGGGGYDSNPQTCSDTCQNGDVVQHSLPIGVVTSLQSQETADQLAQSICFKQLALRKLCFGFGMAPACVGTFYEHIFQVTGGTPPYNIQISAVSLPVGFSLDNATGYFQGTPTTSGFYNLELLATDSSTPPIVIHKTFPFYISEITSPSAMLPGSINTPYLETLTQVGVGAGVWSIQSGSLPPGLTLASATGVISGTPTATGSFNFQVALITP